MSESFDLQKFAKAIIKGDLTTIESMPISNEIVMDMYYNKINILGLRVFGIDVYRSPDLEEKGGNGAFIGFQYDGIDPKGEEYSHIVDIRYNDITEEFYLDCTTLGSPPSPENEKIYHVS